ncbi:molecular chaperone [Candidatus Symbiopectobacterium sp. NZEC127]|uniref:fimbrial biogenesis chaperone n=1 Tax=Candidatus Symbiopectobacterium sp. NZEC127 TaxID=2820472 RepID=UPI0022264158|nr:molecular chaperone [Candidatus Symbiopectobacterium sp. NZEC127]MCW2485397.1 molecular chaperone [Candidatus Symbiopectobacterium sp. NZEC127]
MQRISLVMALLLSLFTVPTTSQADGFGINASRLIYPQGADSISVSVRNTTASQPYLVQARVSRAQANYQPAPFLVRPPLFRLEPGAVNQLRISAQNINAPTDRESLFYFHASAVPASTPPADQNSASKVHGATQFGVGSIIKLFYRPNALPSTSREAQQNLKFSRVDGGIKAENASAYFISFASLQVGGQHIRLDTPEKLTMAPFSNQIFKTGATRGDVRWQTINDEGAVNAFTQTLP